MGGVHALLSCSGSHRWLTCTPSAHFEQQFPQSAGVAADEGTLAHAIAELLISSKAGRINKLQMIARLRPLQGNELYTEAMLTYCDEYASWVIEQFAHAQAEDETAILLLESEVDLSEYVPQGKGTRDVAIIGGELIHVIDFKYGRGVIVNAEEPQDPEADPDDELAEAEGNPQLNMYGLGTLLEYRHVYGIKRVRGTIYQPRLSNISTTETSVPNLLFWAETTLRPTADKAFRGDGEFIAGAHCRFCSAAGGCRANMAFNSKLLRFDFRNENALTLSEISEVLNMGDLFVKWHKAVKEYALEIALRQGAAIPMFKVVSGRSNRKYLDVKGIEASLLSAGYKKEYFYKKPELLTITAMEAAISKPKFEKLVAPFTVKAPGAPTLAHVTDTRAVFRSAEAGIADFADIIFPDEDVDFI